MFKYFKYFILKLILYLYGIPYMWKVAGAANEWLGFDDSHEVRKQILIPYSYFPHFFFFYKNKCTDE